ncbi:retrovirus-related pol polyprotein from transposon TNT 1-94 [Tanacetum coccineum]
MNTRSTRKEPTTPYSKPERFIHHTKKKKKRRNPFIPVENRIPKVNYSPFENLFEALLVYNPFLDLPFLMDDDQPMWGNNRAVAPTLGAAIVVVDLGDNFTIKDTIKLKLFPSSLAGDVKVWFNKLSPCVIATWEQMRQAFFYLLDENGVVSRNKARLVAQGYNQQEGIDYDETYAPVARLESIRILLAYACALDFKLFQMDVKSAFLNGFINEEVYVAQPPGFIDFAKPNHVYRLKKALYGLKQAPKAWYDRLKAFLIKHDYTMGMVDNTLFTKKKDPNLIIVQIYVDDIIFGSTCQEMCDDFAKIMHDEFEMSMMGELNFFLGLQIKQLEDGIFFNQSKYIKEMLKKFRLEDSKPMKTPISTKMKLTKDEEGESVDNTKYRGMIGSLLYLTASRSDIMFSVCLCSRFQEDPKTSHLEAVKRILQYVKGTTHLGLWYPKGSGIETIVYADSDHAGDYGCQKLNHCNSSNEVDVNSPKPMPNLQSPTNEPTTHSNHVSLQSHSASLRIPCGTNVGQAHPHKSINQSQTQPPFLHLHINPHVASVLHAQTPPPPQGDNHTQPPLLHLQ